MGDEACMQKILETDTYGERSFDQSDGDDCLALIMTKQSPLEIEDAAVNFSTAHGRLANEGGKVGMMYGYSNSV